MVDIICCNRSTTVFSHSQTVVVCGNCQTVLCQPTGGRARLTKSSFRRKSDWGDLNRSVGLEMITRTTLDLRIFDMLVWIRVEVFNENFISTMYSILVVESIVFGGWQFIIVEFCCDCRYNYFPLIDYFVHYYIYNMRQNSNHLYKCTMISSWFRYFPGSMLSIIWCSP